MAPTRPLVAVLAPEPIRPRMAGMGIRSLELARAVGTRFDVRLLVPNDPAEAAEVEVGRGGVRQSGFQGSRFQTSFGTG